MCPILHNSLRAMQASLFSRCTLWCYRLFHHVLPRLLTVHILLLATSLPFLVARGLPISLLGVVGTVLFTPLLACVLFVSAYTVVAGFCACDAPIFYRILDTLCRWWIALLAYGPDTRIAYAFHPATYPIICVTPLLCCIGIWYTRNLAPWRTALYLMLVGGMCHILFRSAPTPQKSCIQRGSATISLYRTRNVLSIDDPGTGIRQKSIYQWIAYTLLPHIGLTWGKTACTHLTLQRATPQSIGYVTYLCRCKAVRGGIHVVSAPRNVQKELSRIARVYNVPITYGSLT